MQFPQMEDAVHRVRSALTMLHPRGRRWLSFLRSLPLDPDRLATPLAASGKRDFIICGAPRTGTTLLTAMLFQPPRVVTVMEPWDGMRLAPAELFGSVRESLARTGGVLESGKLDADALLKQGAVQRVPEGSSRPKLQLDHNYSLGIKWPAFWRYLELLPEARFLVCVRDPREVIASFKKEGGRLRLGLEYDTAFNRSINRELSASTRSAAVRRVRMYDHINSSIARHASRPNVFIVRYERWFQDPERLLREMGAFLGVRLDEPPASIRPPTSASHHDEADLRLIRQHVSEAAAFGYDLDAPGSAPAAFNSHSK